MKTFAERLFWSFTNAQPPTTRTELGNAAGIASSSLSDWFGGNTKPETVKAVPLVKAAAFLKVNPMWLLTGFGESSAAAPTTLLVRSPDQLYDLWPFESIDRRRYSALPDRKKGLIDGYALRLVEEYETAIKPSGT